MCAIFGFVARGKSRVSGRTLERMVAGNVARGPHAFGMAWIDSDGRLHCYKQRGRFTDHLGILAMARDARMLIGHLRYATHGDPSSNINNHPHPADGGWIVHNGVVHNHRELQTDLGLPMVSECDSEVLGLLIEQSSAPLLRRFSDAVEQADGGLAMMGLWARPSTLIIARRGNPLHMTDTVDGVYFATLPGGLPGSPAAVADNSIRAFTRVKSVVKFCRRKLRGTTRIGGLFDSRGEYVGG